MRVLIICLLLSLPISGFAEAPQGVRFRLLAWSDIIEGIHIMQNGRDVPVIARDFARSEFHTADLVELAGGGWGFPIYELTTDPEGKPVRRELTVVRPGTLDPPLLVLLTRTPEGGLISGVSSDSTTGFPPGSVRVVNVSSYPLGLQLGTNRTTIAPNGEATLPSKPSTPTGKMEVQAVAMTKPPQSIYHSVWRIAPKDRKLMFAMDTGIPTRPVTFKIITENAVWDSPAVEPASAQGR